MESPRDPTLPAGPPAAGDAPMLTRRDPFRIDGPALVSVSGGRTSMMMLRRIIDAHDGYLPNSIVATFANTGKEREETLDFVDECSRRWNVEIAWLEYRWTAGAHTVARVDYATASRNGEPFDQLISARSMLPNPVMRFCTQELKIRVMAKYAKAMEWEHWTNVIGLRADEPSRLARMRAPNRERWDIAVPMATTGLTKRDVGAFWAGQPFDLGLPSVNGTTPDGNCDLCFLKSQKTICSIMRRKPSLASWWIGHETTAPGLKAANNPRGAYFRKDRPSYAELLDATQRQADLWPDDDPIVDCFCGEAA